MGPNYSISTACATANYAFVSGAPGWLARLTHMACGVRAWPACLPPGVVPAPAAQAPTRCSIPPAARPAAANHIRNGDADVMVAGGSEAPIIPVGLGGFVACRRAWRAVTLAFCVHALGAWAASWPAGARLRAGCAPAVPAGSRPVEASKACISRGRAFTPTAPAAPRPAVQSA